MTVDTPVSYDPPVKNIVPVLRDWPGRVMAHSTPNSLIKEVWDWFGTVLATAVSHKAPSIPVSAMPIDTLIYSARSLGLIDDENIYEVLNLSNLYKNIGLVPQSSQFDNATRFRTVAIGIAHKIAQRLDRTSSGTAKN
jgi:hypothetical protein